MNLLNAETPAAAAARVPPPNSIPLYFCVCVNAKVSGIYNAIVSFVLLMVLMKPALFKFEFASFTTSPAPRVASDATLIAPPASSLCLSAKDVALVTFFDKKFLIALPAVSAALIPKLLTAPAEEPIFTSVPNLAAALDLDAKIVGSSLENE